MCFVTVETMLQRSEWRHGLPGWRPIVFAPFWAILWWVLAYAIAGTQAPRGVESSFRWSVLLPMIVGFWWSIAVVVLVILRLGVGRFAPRWWWCFSILATVANLAGVLALFGYTATIFGSDGWPETALAVGSLAFAGVVSLAPIAWTWHQHITDPIAADAEPTPVHA